MAPQTLIPDTSRLKDEMYYLPFIKHLVSHLSIIEEFNIKIKSSSNYFFDTSYMYKPEFKNFRQQFNDILYARLNPLLEAGIVNESNSCCDIKPNICVNIHPEIANSWLRLLNSIFDNDFVIILGFEDTKIDYIKINSKSKKAIKFSDEWYLILNEIVYFNEATLHLAIKINSKREKISIDKEYSFSDKFHESVEGLDDKTIRNVVTTLVDALHTVHHRAEKLKHKNNEYRKDCNNDYRIHYCDCDGKLIFLHYGKHEVGM